MPASTTCTTVPQDISEERLPTRCSCCSDLATTESHSFRGLLLAIPAGLLLWAGLLKIVVGIAHRL